MRSIAFKKLLYQLNGKTICNSSCGEEKPKTQVISTCLVENSLALGQLVTEAKLNEAIAFH